MECLENKKEDFSAGTMSVSIRARRRNIFVGSDYSQQE